MLTGREEPNPVGYPWIEFARINADRELDHFVCGCGIRANASTDRVTTWWFATDRRPGFDFSLLDRRTPRTVDALRTILGPTAVFSQVRRSDYRTEVRARLFGGADLEQHIRLLHIVRSPRVGDNMASLRRTTEALAGVSGIYESYAQLELRNGATEDLHRVVRAARRVQEAANANATAAAAALSSSELDVFQGTCSFPIRTR